MLALKIFLTVGALAAFIVFSLMAEETAEDSWRKSRKSIRKKR